MAAGRGSKVSVKARLGWRLLRHSRILVALQVEDAARRRQYDGRQGSAASKSAESRCFSRLGDPVIWGFEPVEKGPVMLPSKVM
jgi:hypothetical protein